MDEPVAAAVTLHTHRDRPQDAGGHRDIQGGRLGVQVAGCPELDDTCWCTVEHDDRRGQRHRIGRVVRRHERGDLVATLQQLDLGPHPAAEVRVEWGERLVEQEYPRRSHHRPGDLDQLLLTA